VAERGCLFASATISRSAARSFRARFPPAEYWRNASRNSSLIVRFSRFASRSASFAMAVGNVMEMFFVVRTEFDAIE
jgi:hypothetical protein